MRLQKPKENMAYYMCSVHTVCTYIPLRSDAATLVSISTQARLGVETSFWVGIFRDEVVY